MMRRCDPPHHWQALAPNIHSLISPQKRPPPKHELVDGADKGSDIEV